MSRRYRDQSSSAPGIRFAKPQQTHPSPASVSQSSRFARGSSAQQPVSTPATTITRFRDRPRTEDEIETSFEEADQASPPLPLSSRFSSSVLRSRVIAVDDLDGDEEDILYTDSPLLRSRKGLLVDIGEDEDLADLEFLERLRGTRTSQNDCEPDIEASSSESACLPTPAPSRKRKRLENRTDHDLNAIDAGEDQIEHMSMHATAAEERGDGLAEVPPDSDELPSSPLTASAHAPPSRISSRFRLATTTPVPTSFSHHHTPGTTSTLNSHKPSFRPPADPSAASASSPNYLPSAFSPSRRRGGRGRDYLPGGAAETVRNWILGLGAAEEHAQRQGHGIRSVDKVNVAELVGREAAGRFIMVKDDVGRRWALVGDETGGTARGLVSNWERKRVQAGRVVGVKMGWDIGLDLNTSTNNQGRDGVGSGHNEELWKVAVLWNVENG